MKRGLNFITVIWLTLCSGAAQAATYSYQPVTYAWDAGAATNVVWEMTATGNPIDDDKQLVPIGFTFTYGGVAYTQVRILSNGALHFGANQNFHQVFTNTQQPAGTADRIIAPYWDDLNPSAGGTVRYSTVGSAPNRRLVVSWENVPHYPNTGTYTFQVILYENGTFRLQYGAGSTDGTSATIGAEVSNTNFTEHAFNTVGAVANSSAYLFFTSPMAEYAMEQTAWAGAGSVLDSSGNANHGNPLGAATTQMPAPPTPPITCRAANLPNNTTTGAISGVNTTLDVDTRSRRSGTLSFWYKSTTTWNAAGSNRQLFDATTTNNRWFFLVKRNNGALRFVVTDDGNATVAAQTGTSATAGNTWVHIAVSWSYGSNRRLRIYKNGVLQVQTATSATQTRALNAAINTLYLGDNRSGVTGSNGTGNSANGQIDEVRFHTNERTAAEIIADMNATRPCAALNHIRLLHDGSALTCNPETVTVQACSDATCTTFYTGAVTTTLQPAGWVGGDTINFTGGSTTAPLRRTTTGTVTLGATATSPVPTTAARCFIGALETCALQFFDSGFVFDVPDLVAGKTSAAVTISAVRTSPPATACVPAFASVTRTVNFWSTYLNPATGTLSTQVNAGAVATGAPGTGVNLAFNASGQSTFTVNYADVGRMQLNARFVGTGAEAGLVMNGNDQFVVRPFGFNIAVAGNPAAVDHTGGVLAKAGANFNTTVTAVVWQGGDDLDNDGVPDSGANLADNPATPNFGNEGETVTLTPTLLLPSPGSNGTLTGGSGINGFVSGVRTVPLSYSEVGIIRLNAALTSGNYLGMGQNVTGVTGNVGRFIPDHFTLTGGALTHRSDIAACADTFTYMDETFGLAYTLRAENVANGVTQNYTGLFAKLDLTSPGQMNYAAVSGTSNLTARLSGTPAGAWSNGSAAINLNYRITRAAAPDGPYPNLHVGIAPLDSDTVQILTAQYDMDVDGVGGNEHRRIGSTEARFGRLRLQNAFGSERLPLPLPVRLQYWNGTGFITHTSDSCTFATLAASNLSYTFGGTGNNLNACETQGTLVSLSPGVLQLNLTAPGIGNDGWVDLSFNLGASASGSTCPAGAATTANKPYLQGNWGGNPYNKNPSARARFGAYKGADRLIFQREDY